MHINSYTNKTDSFCCSSGLRFSVMGLLHFIQTYTDEVDIIVR